VVVACVVGPFTGELPETLELPATVEFARASFEGQAAMELEHAAGADDGDAFPFPLREVPGAPGGAMVLDWGPLLDALREDLARGTTAGTLSARFHTALARGIEAVAGRAGLHTVVLSGGCFQNLRLVSETARRLQRAGHDVLVHRQVPANDGGLSLGQVAVAAAQRRAGPEGRKE